MAVKAEAEAEAEAPEYRHGVTARPEAVAGVRRIVGALVGLWGHEQLAEDAALCASELLSNVNKHADRPECVLTLQLRPSGVRLTVSDTSRALPVLRAPEWSCEGGRGLIVLQQIGCSWGAEPTDTGKDVWVELTAARAEAAA